MARLVISFTSCVLLVFTCLFQIQVQGKVTSSQFAPKSYVSEANPAEGLATSYSTISQAPTTNNQQHDSEASNNLNGHTAAGNSDQGRNNGVSNSPYQSADSSYAVPSYAAYQYEQPSLQSPYFYGSPSYYGQKHGGFPISRQTFPIAPTGGTTGTTGTGGGDDGGLGGIGGLGGLGGLVGLLGLKGLKGLKALKGLNLLSNPLLAPLLLPLLLPILPILLLLPLIPLILLLFIPIPVIVSPATGRTLEGPTSFSLTDGVSLRMLHLSSALPKLASDVLNSEDCVERISCEITKMSKSYKMTAVLNKLADKLPKASLISRRIVKGMAQDDYSSTVQDKPSRGSKKVAPGDVKGCEVFTCKPKALLAKRFLQSDE